MSWVFITEPITGVVLGPRHGALAVGIGVLVGHFFNYRGAAEFLFMLGARVGAMISGYVYRQKLRHAAVYQTALLAAYFLTPVAWELPIWGMWDTYLAYILLMWSTTSTWSRVKASRDRSIYRFVLSAFVGLESDILFRIFLFIPCHTYSFIYGFDVETLRYVWLGGALVTPLQVAISLLAGTLVATRLTSIGRVQKQHKNRMLKPSGRHRTHPNRSNRFPQQSSTASHRSIDSKPIGDSCGKLTARCGRQLDGRRASYELARIRRRWMPRLYTAFGGRS